MKTTETSNFSQISTWKNPIFAEPESNTMDSETIPDMSIPLDQLIRDHTIDPNKYYYEDLGDDDITREEYLKMDIIDRKEYEDRITNEVKRYQLGLQAQKEAQEKEDQILLKAAREAQELTPKAEEAAKSDGKRGEASKSTNPLD